MQGIDTEHIANPSTETTKKYTCVPEVVASVGNSAQNESKPGVDSCALNDAQ